MPDSNILLVIQMVENDRQRILAIERLILETICFNFTARMPFAYVIKIGKEMQGMRFALSSEVSILKSPFS